MILRNRNIILFFEENENAKSISSKIVLLYMNRFIIDENQKFEITGVFNLAKISGIFEGSDKQLMNITMRNWIEDRQLIKEAFQNIKSYSWLKTEIHIFMGTSLYQEVFKNNDLLQNLVQMLAERFCPFASISWTLLNGQKYELHTKTKVQDVYRNYRHKGFYNFDSDILISMLADGTREFLKSFGQNFRYDFIEAQSLNDDLENLYNFSADDNGSAPNCHLNEKQLIRGLFLYEMYNGDEFRTKRDELMIPSDDNKFLLSLCRRLTIHLIK